MFILSTLPDYNAALPVFFTHASSNSLISYICCRVQLTWTNLLKWYLAIWQQVNEIKILRDIFNYSNHLSMTRWILIKQFHLAQPCASIQDSLWGKLTAVLNSFFFSHPHCNIIFGEVAYIYNEGSLCPLGHTGRITICNSNGKAEFDRYMENKEPEAQQ